MTDAAPQHQIRIEVDKPRATLGDAIALRVVFRNASGETLELRDPEHAFGVVISAQRGGERAEEIRMGRLLEVNMGGGTALVPEPGRTIELKPGGEHVFQLDAGHRFPQLFAPGLLALRIVDRSERTPVSSNAVRLSMEIAPRSVDFLVGLLADPDAPGRDFAVDWLKQLQPSFRFTAARPNPAQQAENQAALAAFRDWWTTAKSSPETARRIAELNSR